MTPRKLFPLLSIRSKLIIAFVGFSVVPVVLVGFYGLYANVGTLRQFALEKLSHDVQTIRANAGNFLSGVESDLMVVRRSSAMNRFIGSYQQHRGAVEPAVLRQFGNDLKEYCETKGVYYRLSIVNEEKDELLRVECRDVVNSFPQFRILPDTELRRGGASLYALLAENLGDNQITFSPAELIYQESKQIPVLNFILPLYGGNHRIGVFVASVFAKNLFEVMQTTQDLKKDEQIILVDDNGSYYYHSGLLTDWNSLIARRAEGNLRNDYPAPVWQKILSGTEGIITEEGPNIIAYAPLVPPKISSAISDQPAGLRESLYLFESVPRPTITGPARSFALVFAGFLFVFLCIAVFLGVGATHQFTRPIAEVARGAEIISHGNYKHRLNVYTGDEIERLSEQFNRMAHALEMHDEEIADHRIRLEEIVKARASELVEEKAKLRAILDNVPSAFVLLTKDNQIQAVSAAFTTVTGIQMNDLRGKNAAEVFSSGGFCTKDLREWILRGKSESHIDKRTDQSGAVRLIEHTTIPLNEEPIGGAVVMIMTDITQRKRLEQQLIQSEKLMATGEMAAIIAHEFRNALTSIKMILQLQQEDQQQSEDTRFSLGVALDSIHHMESVVQGLLNFARPSPMEFRPTNLSTVMDECLSFVKLRIRKLNISLTSRCETDIPLILTDASRIKEAVINILLNAIQAIETRNERSKQEEIAVSVKRVTLTKTLRDLVSVDRDGEENVSPNGHSEIVLRKGQECLLVGISDTGPGIDRNLLHRIFDPFFTTKVNGTGLGLPMVKRTVNAHGGIVIVKSVKGKGSVFELVFPVHNGDLEGTSTTGT